MCVCVECVSVLELGCLISWICVHEKWYQTILVSYQQSFMCSPSARIMLIQLKWHVDPWIKHLVAIYFLLFKTWSFNFKLVFCALCGFRSVGVNRVFEHLYLYARDQTILHFLMEVLMRTAFQLQNHHPTFWEKILFNEMCFHFAKFIQVFQLEFGKRGKKMMLSNWLWLPLKQWNGGMCVQNSID